MAPTTIKGAIKDALEDLGERNLEKFRSELLDRRGERRVKTSAVEGKSFLVIADVLVSTFTESDALTVTLEILRKIGCNEEADALARDTSRLSSTSVCTPVPSAGASGPSAGASGGRAMVEGKHFVDFHRAALIQRVGVVEPIMDELLAKGVVIQETYNKVLSQATNQDKMRELYKGTLDSCGNHGKDLFYKILKDLQPMLVDDLNGQ